MQIQELSVPALLDISNPLTSIDDFPHVQKATVFFPSKPLTTLGILLWVETCLLHNV